MTCTCTRKLCCFPAVAALVLLALAGPAPAQNFICWPVTKVAAGGNHTLFIKSDGTLYAMGNNSSGQLGIGSAVFETNTPQFVTNGVDDVSAGHVHTLYRSGIALWAVGDNLDGELGDHTTVSRNTPEFIAGSFVSGVYVTAIAAGGYHSIFATSSFLFGHGYLLTMGDNSEFQLGFAGEAYSSSPVTILTNNNGPAATAVGAEYFDSLFIEPGGVLYGMGDNSYGQLALGELVGAHASPHDIGPPYGNTVATAGGYLHTLMLQSDGYLWAGGDDTSGQLGYGTNSEQLGPVNVTNNVVAIAAGYFHSLFVKSDGSLWAMGDNDDGQLGDGTTADRLAPVMIVASNVVSVAAGGEFSLFIKSDGSLWGMGANGYGQLGTGDYTEYLSPVEIVAPPPQLSVSVSGTNFVFTWPTNAAVFTLQWSPSLSDPAWTNVPAAPVTTNNQVQATDPRSGPAKFYRLIFSM